MPTQIKQSITQLTVGQFVTGISQQLGNVNVCSVGWISAQNTIDELKAKGVIEVIVDTDKQITHAQKEEQFSTPSSFFDVPFDDELPRARAAIDSLNKQLSIVFSQVRNKQIFDLSALYLAATSFIASSYRNASCLICIIRAMDFKDHQLGHALRTTAYFCKMFKIMQWSPDNILDWILGSLLHDIGKLHMKQTIQQPHLLSIKQATRDADVFITPQHIEHGLNIAHQIGGLAQETIEVIQMHHERYDNSGYPTGEALTDINDPMRMFTIIDELDKLMYIPTNGKFLTPINAYQQLLKMDRAFDIKLLQLLIKSIGVYPPGSVVILKSGRVGIVLEYNKSAIKPDIKLIYDDKTSMHTKVKVISLSKTNESDEIDDFYHNLPVTNLVEQYL